MRENSKTKALYEIEKSEVKYLEYEIHMITKELKAINETLSKLVDTQRWR